MAKEKVVVPGKKKKLTVFDIVLYIVFAILSLIIIIPIWKVLIDSFNAVGVYKFQLWPSDPTFAGYLTIATTAKLARPFINSVVTTVVGTLIGLVMSTLGGYVLNQYDMPGRSLISYFLLFTMIFNAGLVPNYLLINNTLNWSNTIWALIIPNCMNAWYVILMRSYFENSIPADLFEAGEIDGCSVYRQLVTIALPLSGPILAVIALYSAVGLWNGYFDALIYISDKRLYPLQLVLRSILILNEMDMSVTADLRDMASRQGMANLLKYAVIVVSSVPLLIMYPFVQKYFVKGIMVGSVKG